MKLYTNPYSYRAGRIARARRALKDARELLFDATDCRGSAELNAELVYAWLAVKKLIENYDDQLFSELRLAENAGEGVE